MEQNRCVEVLSRTAQCFYSRQEYLSTANIDRRTILGVALFNLLPETERPCGSI